ncbi:MAG: hypothetical protein U0T33_12980 [Bacteroidales bacterium]
MRKALKIKTSVLLVAWMVIFTHSIIPHSHADECLADHGEAIHSISTAQVSHDNSVKISSKPAEEKVCHLLNQVFQSFNPENSIPISEGSISFVPAFKPGKIYVVLSNSFSSSYTVSSEPFRGPPAA